MSELETALKRAGADITALTYVRTLKRNNLIGTQKGTCCSIGYVLTFDNKGA